MSVSSERWAYFDGSAYLDDGLLRLDGRVLLGSSEVCRFRVLLRTDEVVALETSLMCLNLSRFFLKLAADVADAAALSISLYSSSFS